MAISHAALRRHGCTVRAGADEGLLMASTFQWKYADATRANPFRWSTAGPPATQVASELTLELNVSASGRSIVLKETLPGGGTVKQEFANFRAAVAHLERSSGFIKLPPPVVVEPEPEPEPTDTDTVGSTEFSFESPSDGPSEAFANMQGFLRRKTIRQGFCMKKGLTNPSFKRRWFSLDGSAGYLRYWEVADEAAPVRASTQLKDKSRAIPLGEEKGHFDIRDMVEVRIEVWSQRVLNGSRQALQTLRWSRQLDGEGEGGRIEIVQLTDIARRSDALVLRFRSGPERWLYCDNQSDAAAWCYALQASMVYFSSDRSPPVADSGAILRSQFAIHAS